MRLPPLLLLLLLLLLLVLLSSPSLSVKSTTDITAFWLLLFEAIWVSKLALDSTGAVPAAGGRNGEEGF